jgi:hypothetical protein
VQALADDVEGEDRDEQRCARDHYDVGVRLENAIFRVRRSCCPRSGRAAGCRSEVAGATVRYTQDIRRVRLLNKNEFDPLVRLRHWQILSPIVIRGCLRGASSRVSVRTSYWPRDFVVWLVGCRPS